MIEKTHEIVNTVTVNTLKTTENLFVGSFCINERLFFNTYLFDVKTEKRREEERTQYPTSSLTLDIW